MCKINQLPAELFHEIASLLPPEDLERATCVCQSWRQTLLNTPGLWTRIRLYSHYMLASSRSKLTAAFITTLFSRSQGLPVTIEFECWDFFESTRDGYNNIAHTFIAQMHRVKSLSMSLGQLTGTDFELVLLTPAPILKCFRLHVHADGDLPRLPTELFSNQAKLERASFYRVILPDSACSALTSVTRLYYNSWSIADSAVHTINTMFPHVRSLTLVGQEHNSPPCDGITCLLPLTLRLPNLNNVEATMALFPNATTVCLSSALREKDWSGPLATDILEPGASVTSIDIRRRPWQWNVWDEENDPAPFRGDGLSIGLNGTDVNVDLERYEVIDAIEACPLGRDLRTVSVPHDLWRFFSKRRLPVLDTLTLYLFGYRRRDDPITLPSRAAPHRHKISALRLEAVPGSGRRRLSKQDIVNILAAFDPSVLVTIVLCGLDSSLRSMRDALRSVAPHVVISVQPLVEKDATDPWFWKLSETDAIRLY